MDRSEALKKTILNSAPTAEKFRSMVTLYLSSSTSRVAQNRAPILRWLETCSIKYLALNYHLEELWQLSMAKRATIEDFLEAGATIRFNEDEKLLAYISFEAFVQQTRNFIYMWQFLSLLLLGRNDCVQIDTGVFKKELSKVTPEFQGQALNMGRMFEEEVFGDGCWGELLVKLRDKIVHRETLRMGSAGSEKIVEVLVDFRTLTGMTVERFAQDIDNGVFEMIRNSTEILLDTEWQPGPISTFA